MVKMQRLPFDIIKEILSRLPVKSLLRFRCVSKDWCSIISDPFFISQHLHRSSENNPSLCITGGGLFIITFDGSSVITMLDIPFKDPMDHVKILGSCNGLLCLFVAKRLPGWFRYISPIHLWNPATREYKKLPEAPFGSTRIWGISNTALGFGYDPINHEYKVVRIIYYCEGGIGSLIYKSDVRVYSLGTGKWKKLGDVPFHIRHDSSNAVVNGSIHWMAIRDIVSKMSELIISFDLRKEVFQEMHHPACVEGDGTSWNCVSVLGGCLSLIRYIYDRCAEVWVMKDYGVKESWTKQFTVEWSYGHGVPLEIWKSGEILIEKNLNKLVLYSPESKGERDLGIHGLPNHFKSFTFMESLVPLLVGSKGEEQQKA